MSAGVFLRALLGFYIQRWYLSGGKGPPAPGVAVSYRVLAELAQGRHPQLESGTLRDRTSTPVASSAPLKEEVGPEARYWESVRVTADSPTPRAASLL